MDAIFSYIDSSARQNYFISQLFYIMFCYTSHFLVTVWLVYQLLFSYVSELVYLALVDHVYYPTSSFLDPAGLPAHYVCNNVVVSCLTVSEFKKTFLNKTNILDK